MENTPPSSLIDRLNNWISTSVTIKLIVIGILILILMIPMDMVQSLISEREFRQEEAVQEISSKWGSGQTVSGPVLTIPYKRIYRDSSGKVVSEKTHYVQVLPDKLKVGGEMHPETRYRGTFEVVVYNARLNVSGAFPAFDFKGVDADEILWNDAFLSIGITDMRGIRDILKIKWRDSDVPTEPGIATGGFLPSGVSCKVPLAAGDTASIDFSFYLNLNGSNNLYFVPLGKETNVNIQSKWSNPSFTGAFLPEPREITDSSFTAQWKVLHLNRNFPQVWVDKTHNVWESSFGVALLVPVEQYQKSMRSVKYAMMFIGLTFLFFFLVEVMNKTSIHPIQYILVGLALCLFYTLLVSLSEHISFNTAYYISSLAIIGMITLYTRTVFRRSLLTIAMFLVLAGLYGFLFITLQIQDYSLLIGSIGLFAILAVVMFLSRNIDWYGKKTG